MTKEESLQVIKNIIDGALKAGLFQSVEDANTAIQALTTIADSAGIQIPAPNYVSNSTADVKEGEK